MLQIALLFSCTSSTELKLGQKTQRKRVPWRQRQATIITCSKTRRVHHRLSLESSSPCWAFTTILTLYTTDNNGNDSSESSLLHQHLPRTTVMSNTEPKHRPAGIWLGLPRAEGRIDSLFKNASTITVVLSIIPLNSVSDTSGNSTADFPTISILSVLHRHLKTGFQ